MEENKFQNLPSKRLYEFLSKKIDGKEITMQEIADTLDVYKKNPSSYFHALRTGITSVKLDHILKAQEHFGLNPCDLFAKNIGSSELDENLKITDPSLKEIWELVRSQQQTIHLLVSRQDSKGGSM